jgi:hypothetical protein
MYINQAMDIKRLVHLSYANEMRR